MSGSSFTNDNDLEIQVSGQKDWDTANNANYAIIERGYHFKAQAGIAVNTGQILTIGSGGLVWPMNANSMTNQPAAIAYRAASSGDVIKFISQGIVRSMTVWSGAISPGLPVHVSVQSTGFCVKSFNGCGQAVGVALDNTSILFRPGKPQIFPEIVTYTNTLGIITGSNAVFAVPAGYRGTVRDIFVTGSHNAFRLRFWSGSSNVSSELLYSTSISAGSTDISTTSFRDRTLFAHQNTDASSSWYMYGRIDAQSASGVGSAFMAVTVISERIR